MTKNPPSEQSLGNKIQPRIIIIIKKKGRKTGNGNEIKESHLSRSQGKWNSTVGTSGNLSLETRLSHTTAEMPSAGCSGTKSSDNLAYSPCFCRQTSTVGTL